MSDYQFDVFISYSRLGGAAKWLLNNFHPKLEECLIDQVRPRPRIFLDKGMPKGVDWPAELRSALRHSKILIAILSASYFDSPWCMAELRSMRAREKVLDLAGLSRPQGLIYPILYSDSENYPDEEGLHRSWWNFKDLGTGEPVFQVSPEWVHFHRRVMNVAVDLGSLLKQVPAWQPDWPLAEVPEPLLRPNPAMPRF